MAVATKKKASVSPISDVLGIDQDLLEGEIERWPGVWQCRAIISSEQASFLLTRNIDGNRYVRQAKVDAMVRDMKNGDWRSEVAGPIIFTDAGVLIQGQHRLTACVKSAMELLTEILFGVEEAAIDVMDSGIKRTVADVLRMKGVAQAGQVSSAANLYLQFSTGIGRSYQPSNNEILHLVLQREDIGQIVRLARSVTQACGLKTAPLAVVLMKATDVGAPDADIKAFVGELQSGVRAEDGKGLGATSPTFRLREWAQRQARLPRARQQASPSVAYVYGAKAWNKWFTGEPMTTLRFTRGEEFPEVWGPEA